MWSKEHVATNLVYNLIIINKTYRTIKQYGRHTRESPSRKQLAFSSLAGLALEFGRHRRRHCTRPWRKWKSCSNSCVRLWRIVARRDARTGPQPSEHRSVAKADDQRSENISSPSPIRPRQFAHSLAPVVILRAGQRLRRRDSEAISPLIRKQSLRHDW